MNPLESVWHPFPELQRLPPPVAEVWRYGRDITDQQRVVLEERFGVRRVARDELGVMVMECHSYDVAAILDALAGHLLSLEGLGEKLRSASTILIKPNLVEPRLPGEHATSNPLFLEALVQFLRDQAAQAEILVAEATGHERDWRHLLLKTGIQSLLDRYGVEFIDLNCDDVRTVVVKEPETMAHAILPESVCSADLVISFAKLKTHHWAGVTLGMKNLFGCLPGSVYGYPKNRLHWMSIPRVIADLAWTLKPDLTIIDGIVAIEGNGPLDGRPREDGLIIAGTDVFRTDMVASLLMGFSPLLIPQFWFPVLRDKAIPVSLSDIEHLVARPLRPFEPPPNMRWLADSASRPMGDTAITLRRITLEANLGCLSILRRK